MEDKRDDKFSLDDILNLNIFKQHPKLLLRLKINVDQLNFYETHQIYKTLHFRCMTNNLVNESLDLIFNGICFFLENNQNLEGYDLSKTFVETLNKSSITSIGTKLSKSIKRIHQLLQGEERQDFTANILKWLQNLTNKEESTSSLNEIHRVFALTTWKEKNYVQSRYHFLHSVDGDSCARMLINYHIEHGFLSEIDLFITQTVLQYLCMKNNETALVVFQVYTQEHPRLMSKSMPYPLPLLNFVWFLLLAIRERKSAIFNVLCDLYKPCLSRDPSYKDYLNKIGSIYFNIKSKQNESDGGNPLNNILKMFMQSPNTVSALNDNEDNEQLHDLEDNELD